MSTIKRSIFFRGAVGRTFCLLYLLLFQSLIAEEWTVSICAIFKNEGPYLKEWIEYHRLVGVEHFFLYDNGSNDNSEEILKPYLAKGIVELRKWPNNKEESLWIEAQKRAYNHCIHISKKKTRWLALIDIDEFIVPVDQPNLIEFLSPFENKPKIGAIQIHWQLYGTSHLPFIPQDQLLIESLIMKAPSQYRASIGLDNTRMKSMVRPKAVVSFAIHEGKYKPGFEIFPAKCEHIPVDQIRINHYWSRAEDFFYQTKLDRRLQFSPLTRSELIDKLLDLNQVEDRIMDRFIPELKMRLKETSPP